MSTNRGKYSKPVKELKIILERMFKSGIQRSLAMRAITKSIKDLSFLCERLDLELEETDSSYTLRLNIVLTFLSNLNASMGTIGDSELKQYQDTKFWKGKLDVLDKYIDVSSQEIEALGNHFGKPGPPGEEVIVGCVTFTSNDLIFVKPFAIKSDEFAISRQQEKALFHPGDEIEVKSGEETRPKILKCNHRSLEDIEFFVDDLEEYLDDAIDPYDMYYSKIDRFKGIWQYIINTLEFQDNQVIFEKILKVCTTLSEKLLELYEDSCKLFLKDLSSSSFFVKSLPKFIKDTVRNCDSNEAQNLENLLKIMIEVFPSAAVQIFKVARSLADALCDGEAEQGIEELKFNCHWGINLLANLGKILSKFVPGSQDVDTKHCSWVDVQTILTKEELFLKKDISCIPELKTHEPYENKEQYLETNYQLLREECYRNLSLGIQSFLEKPDNYDEMKIRVLKIIGFDSMLSVNSSSEVFIGLKYQDYKSSETSQERKESLCGSLMCISLDKKFSTPLWATVGPPPKNEHCDREANVGVVYIQFCSERNKMPDTEILFELQHLTEKGEHAIMVENPSFFQAFGPSMERLQQAQYSKLPFEDEIVRCEKSTPPDYVVKTNHHCDWKIIFEKSPGSEFSVPDDRNITPLNMFEFLREEGTPSKLDETQLDAIQSFLKNRVCLIQGPPGTGKSYLGTKIVRLMLSMKNDEDFDGPILVVTYKNYALDHFLKSCLEYSNKVLRVGRSDPNCEELSKINLKTIQKKMMSKDLVKKYSEVNKKLHDARSKLDKAFRNLIKQSFSLDAFLKKVTKDQIRALFMTKTTEKDWERELSKCEGCSENLKKMIKDALKNLEGNEEAECFSSSPGRKSHDNLDEVDEPENEARDPDKVMSERLQDTDYEPDNIQAECKDSTGVSNDSDLDMARVFQRVTARKCEEAILTSVFELWRKENETKDYVADFEEAAKDYKTYRKKHKEISDNYTIKLMKEHDVIGMTVTGAAMRLHLLNKIKPCAVIVEEAAEILEGQLISVLSPSLKHLVMLGDQEQLKPAVNCHQLKRYKNLDCSMFERLINNKLEHQQLGTQFRMREDIADIIRALNIYKDLKTKNTEDNKPPNSVGKSMFFFNHTSSEENHETSSKCNSYEIKRILEFTVHLVENGTPPESITVLATYRGQVTKMKKKFEEASRFNSENKYMIALKDIKITTVDSFQGEENDIVLLSLVRSNKKMKIGFLAVKNRICVALSRAKCGLYIFGNAEVYKNSKYWKPVIDLLQKKALLSGKFPYADSKTSFDTGTPESNRTIPDKEPLSPRTIEYLSRDVINRWGALASLLNIEDSKITNIKKSHGVYPEEKDKCKAMLSLYNIQSDFSRKLLKITLSELHLPAAAEKVKLGEESNRTIPDKEPLSPRTIEYLSRDVINRWGALASLLNIEDSKITNIKKSHGVYPEEKDKCKAMLSLYNIQSDFSRKLLKITLSELHLPAAAEKVKLGEVSESNVTISDKEPLSPRTIEDLSRDLINKWGELACLLNMEDGEISNIRRSHGVFPEEKDKCKAMLSLYKKQSNFSRKVLKSILKDELHLPAAAEKVKLEVPRK